MMERILVAGCGITGAVTASLLRKQLSEKCKIALWDKSKGVDLVAARMLKPLTCVIENDNQYPDGTKHFVTPDGASSLAKHFLNNLDAEIKLEHKIVSITEHAGKWQVATESGTTDLFDCVVLTFPVPQILQLQGSIQSLLDGQPEVKEKLSKVVYSSRYALGLFYEPGAVIDVPWAAKYVQDEVIRFVSIDNRKRSIDLKEVGPSVAVHTSVPFSLAHLDEDTESVCNDIVLPRVQQLIQELPQGARMKTHKWRYSQVFKAYEGSPGMLVLKENPLLICAGDGFTMSKFDNCLQSAKCTTDKIVKTLHN